MRSDDLSNSKTSSAFAHAMLLQDATQVASCMPTWMWTHVARSTVAQPGNEKFEGGLRSPYNANTHTLGQLQFSLGTTLPPSAAMPCSTAVRIGCRHGTCVGHTGELHACKHTRAPHQCSYLSVVFRIAVFVAPVTILVSWIRQGAFRKLQQQRR